MTGKKGASGGARSGAGRKATGRKPPKDYVIIRLPAPKTAKERKAIKYAQFLSPEERLKVFMDDLSFQDWTEKEGWVR